MEGEEGASGNEDMFPEGRRVYKRSLVSLGRPRGPVVKRNGEGFERS